MSFKLAESCHTELVEVLSGIVSLLSFCANAHHDLDKLGLTHSAPFDLSLISLITTLKIPHTYFVYIVECKDWSYYSGVTNDIERRLWEHNTGHDDGCYTYTRRPVELKYFEIFNDIKQAIAIEKQIKTWSRKKKQALIVENYEKLKEYAKSKNKKE